MSDEQRAMIRRLQELGLTMDDLREYLDTHPTDSFANERYAMTAAEYHKLTGQYTETYGPLSFMPGTDRKNWQWALQDFPWDN